MLFRLVVVVVAAIARSRPDLCFVFSPMPRDVLDYRHPCTCWLFILTSVFDLQRVAVSIPFLFLFWRTPDTPAFFTITSWTHLPDP